MKFFTRQWHAGGLPGREAEKVPQAYADHLKSLLPRVPPALLALAQNVNLHDGRIQQVRFDRAACVITLEVRCGDLQSGYFDADLTYEGIDLTNSDLSELRTIAHDPRAEILYDEVDAGFRGQWVHRILYWPYREVCIQFGALRLHVEPRSTREFTRNPNVYVELS
jgi:hypothetical protein